MKEAIKNELLRQAKLTFNLAVSVSAISAIITLSGVGLVYFNKLSEAALTGSAGALATMTCLNMAKESKDELLKIMEDEEEEDEN
ncbi:MAG: TRADD-N-associated membrane domain-containing protein [Cuspidothrix sp.]